MLTCHIAPFSWPRPRTGNQDNQRPGVRPNSYSPVAEYLRSENEKDKKGVGQYFSYLNEVIQNM